MIHESCEALGRTEDWGQKAWSWSSDFAASWLDDLWQVDIAEPLFLDLSTGVTAHRVVTMMMNVKDLQTAKKCKCRIIMNQFIN